MNDISKYYIDLLIIQYQALPKTRAFLEAVLKKVLIFDILFQIRDGFDIETAVGKQLDILGEYIGVSRTYEIAEDPDSTLFFGMIDGSNADHVANPQAFCKGFSDFSNPSNWFITSGLKVVTMDDELYRQILKLKIKLNSIDYTVESIEDILSSLFKDKIILYDTNSMQLVYRITEVNEFITASISKRLLPKPAGVGVKGIIDDRSFFGMIDGSISEHVQNPQKYTGGFGLSWVEYQNYG